MKTSIALLLFASALFVLANAQAQPAHSARTYVQIAYTDAVEARIDPNIFERQINQESGFNPNVVSPAGAIGVAQIMPETAASWGIDPHDPVASLKAAAQHMAAYLHQYGSYALALAAYNAGSGWVERCKEQIACLPAETRAYIAIILQG